MYRIEPRQKYAARLRNNHSDASLSRNVNTIEYSNMRVRGIFNP